MTEVSETSSKDSDKTITMPDAQNMEQKLTTAGLIGMTEQSDRVIKRFIQSVAGSKKVAVGLVMAWSLANYDELKDYPPQVQTIMNMHFDEVIDTVTPSPEIAKEAKDFMASAREESKK